ncbi:MAG: TIM barrel protein [Peptococcaceae bacterium]|nr:TIM barrel protein [Peptococcaceae bacterium]
MPDWLREKGLNAYEYQCGRGVKIGEEMAVKLGQKARENGIFLSIHGPYYINLATLEIEGQEKSMNYLLDSVRAAQWMGAEVVVFHPGSGKGIRSEAIERAKILLKKVIATINEQGIKGIYLAPETMGKKSLLGSLDEILDFCAIDEMIIPCIDFGHLHAINGGALNSVLDFSGVLDRIEEKLGSRGIGRLHMHFSPIEFTAAGEKRHRKTSENSFGPDFSFLAPLLLERAIEFTLICESDGVQAEDALVYKKIYTDLQKADDIR